jgi:CRP/FNR family transcriptional regulator/CRP/FNR family cyclic AMP-dependent transcriptional regulator
VSAKTDLLKGVDLFSPLSDAQLGYIADMTVEKRYARGDTILLEDDSSNQTFFLLAEGSVKVVLTAEDGREAILATLGEGDFFGEMSLLDGEPRSATVRSVGRSRLLVIHREDFLKSLRKHPDLAQALLVEMSHRLRRSNRQVSSLALMRVCGRVASTLSKLMEERGVRTRTQEGKSIVIVRDRPTHQTIADMSGTTRETVTRVFKLLESKGAISAAGKDLVILEETRLRA